MKKLFLFIFVVFPAIISAQYLDERHRNIRAEIENRDYAGAIARLQQWRKAERKTFELNNYDYLLARLSEKTGDFASAAGNYQSVVNRNSVLTEYALLHLAEISRNSGNLFLERIYLRELNTIAPESQLNDAAMSRSSRSSFESKDYDAAILSLRSSPFFDNPHIGEVLGGKSPLPIEIFGFLVENDQKTREQLTILGKAYFQSGKNGLARAVFTHLVEKLENPSEPDDFALEAVRGLDKLDVGSENYGKTAPELSDSEQINRADIYQFNRDFENARLHYSSFINRFPNDLKTPRAMYQIGRGYMQEKRYSDAADWFERIREQYPLSEVSKDALYQSAAAYTRVNKTKEAVSRYQEFIGIRYRSQDIERSYLNIVDIMRDKGETGNALKWTAKTREDFRDQMPEALAIFAQSRIHISQKDWQKALNDLESLRFMGNLGGADVPGGTNLEEITFLKAYVLEQLNRIDEAIDEYLSIRDGRKSYYGWRATEKLKQLSSSENSASNIQRKLVGLSGSSSNSEADERRKLLQSIFRLTNNKGTLETIGDQYSKLSDYSKIPKPKLLEFGRKEILTQKPINSTNSHQALADELLFLGVYDEGTPELEISWQSEQKAATDDEKYTLAVYYNRGDMANRAIAYIEPLWKNVPEDYQIELIPRDQLELLYPAPYADSLVKFATPRGVDPRFVLAIMRQEARFQPDVKSVAAARGLMQFISSTSNQIATELKRENFKQEELYDPPTAILFGSQYLSNLFHEFPDQPQAVAASHNGGEENMARWYARAGSSDPDLYVPEILYTQSKDYVYRVMQNYRIYQMIYDENLKLKNSN